MYYIVSFFYLLDKTFPESNEDRFNIAIMLMLQMNDLGLKEIQ